MAAATVSVDPRLELARLRELTRSLLEQNEQLETALQSRIVIEQAKGILAERYGITPEEAFTLLRGAARSNRLRLHAVAAAVVARDERPELAGLLARRSASGPSPAA